MKHVTLSSSLLLLSTLLVTSGCRPSGGEPSAPAREPLVPPRLLAAKSAAPAGTVEGSVMETLAAGAYTYVRVNSGGQSLWAAAPDVGVEVGDLAQFSTAMPMTNFESETLGRTFAVVYFTDSVQGIGGGRSSATPATPAAPAAPAQASREGLDHDRSRPGAAAGLDFSGIEVPQGGLTVAAIHERAAALAETPVLVRGRVAKFTPAVMDRNWLHLQDGSGEGATADLTVMTAAVAAVGDLVTIQGQVAVDQNFGFGYEYAVLVKDALVTVE